MKNNDYKANRDDGIIEAYQGYHIDNNELLKSASGGLATAISEKIINNSGVVYGVVYSDDFKSAHYACATTIEELQPLQSSKYIKAHLTYDGVKVFDDVKKHLETGIPVLFVGLSCTVMALSGYLKKPYSNLIMIDLLCYGPTEDIVAEKYISRLEEEYNSKVVSFNVRYKEKGWDPPFLRAEFENGEIYMKEFYLTDYGKAFLIYPKLACTQCVAKGSNHRSDITIGDFWGISEGDEGYNNDGVSIAFTRSLKGRDLLTSLDNFKLRPASIDFAISNNIIINHKKSVDLNKRKEFERSVKRDGLKAAVAKAYSIH